MLARHFRTAFRQPLRRRGVSQADLLLTCAAQDSAKRCTCATARLSHPRRHTPAEGIKLAEADGVDWVFHVDTDELMYPASSAEYSLQVCLFLCDPPCRGVTLRDLLIQRGVRWRDSGYRCQRADAGS